MKSLNELWSQFEAEKVKLIIFKFMTVFQRKLMGIKSNITDTKRLRV